MSADFDYAALVHEGRGRRISPASPEHSLLLRKATGQMPHGGGARFSVGGEEYNTILAWLNQGTPRKLADEPTLTRVEASPDAIIIEKSLNH